PHLCGDSIPGWRVTRENTDWLEDSSPNQDTWHPQDGSRVMDVGGHGPGGIAQTISGLAPNGTYTLEFYAARHRFWGSEDMITDLWSNGDLKLKVVRTTDQDAQDGPLIREEVDLTSSAAGEITIELFSMNVDKGGNNVLDAFRIIKKQDPPQWGDISNQTTNLNAPVSLQLSATDSDNDELTFSATALPDGLTLNKTTGLVTGAPTSAGTFEVSVGVTDGNFAEVSESFNWIVNAPPSITIVDNQITQLNKSINLNVQASDPENQAITFDAQGLPNGLSISSSTGKITGTAEKSGNYLVTILAADSRQAESTITFDWLINSPPTIQPIDNLTSKVDTPLSFKIEASDPEEGTLVFAAEGLPTGLTLNTTTGDLTGTPTVVQTYFVAITVTDENGGLTRTSFVWVVEEKQISPTATPGAPTGNLNNSIYLPNVLK
ncbi:MAG: putative Ig domain-containing protein, partial [Chloroflexota bacterium]